MADGNAAARAGCLRCWETPQSRRTNACAPWGPYRAAEAAWPALQAYADGVDAFLAEGHPLPPEFVILGFKPEPWNPADSLVWAKMMSWNLDDTYGADGERYGQMALA